MATKMTLSPKPYPLNPILAIVGPTGSGKSNLAMKIAKDFNGEIICADSRTVYKGMDIGTGKPSKSDQEAIQHHLLDIVQVNQLFTAVDFKKAANKAIDVIQKRGKLPILVGGSGLYTDAVLFDYEFLPIGDPKERSRLNGLSIEELHQELDKKRITPPLNYKNKRHLIRSIETTGNKAAKKKMRTDTLVVGLSRDNKELKRRIAKRNKQMIRQGLEQEVRGLVNKYGWEAKSLDAIGYREWQDYFDGKIDIERVRELITKNSIAYARRQKTWFKRNPYINWFSSTNQAYKYIAASLNTQIMN